MIIFKYVRWKNLLSTGNNFTEIDLTRNTTTLIIGENGAGKSTILDALCFGLFGKPFRNINKSQLLNSVNNSAGMVEVDFSIGSKEFLVRRGIKPNIFEIHVNGKIVNQDANARDYQKFLEQQILKLNFRSFTQVVILGSSTFIPFMQLKAKQRREVVEDILDIRIFSLMNLILKQQLKEISNDLKDIQYKYDLNLEQISMQEKYIAEMKSNKKTVIAEKANLIANNEEEVHKKLAKITMLKDSNEELLKEIGDKTKQELGLKKLLRLQSTIEEKRNSNAKMVEFFKNNDDCPTCEQPLVNSDEMVTVKQQEVDKFTDALKEMETAVNKTQNRLSDINATANKIHENEVSLAKENSSMLQLEKFSATLQGEINTLEEQGGVLKADKDKLKELQSSLKGVSNSKDTLREDQTYAEAAQKMLLDSGIKTKIIKQYLPIMNKLINTYLTSMEFYVNFTLDENFTETIKSRYRDEFTYDSFSEGEKMRIDLALLFTWRAIAKMKNSTNTNLLILDEIFDSSLDGGGTDEFLKILHTLADENIFVISHKKDMLVDKFKSTIEFEKIKNFSHIKE